MILLKKKILIFSMYVLISKINIPHLKHISNNEKFEKFIYKLKCMILYYKDKILFVIQNLFHWWITNSK